ncbi:hypothetical protein BJ742DRAFT_911847 [Cladochytrium replicatum]|nr:hypothetical protein BJ742DRAFT_911847 [Cladochytrium replicatum]
MGRSKRAARHRRQPCVRTPARKFTTTKRTPMQRKLTSSGQARSPSAIFVPTSRNPSTITLSAFVSSAASSSAIFTSKPTTAQKAVKTEVVDSYHEHSDHLDDLKKIQIVRDLRTSIGMCRLHCDELKDLYCMECRIALCHDCIMSSAHREHPWRPLLVAKKDSLRKFDEKLKIADAEKLKENYLNVCREIIDKVLLKSNLFAASLDTSSQERSPSST